MWIVPDAQRELTPHRYTRGNSPVGLVVFHWTGSPRTHRGARLGSDESRQRAWLRGERQESSTNLDILRDGYVLQGAPVTDRTWHSGGSVLTIPSGRVIDGINRRSIGIDLDNVGPLFPVGGRYVNEYEWRAMKKYERLSRRFYSGPPPFISDDGRAWEPYSHLAIGALMRIVHRLVCEFPILRQTWRLVGHEHIRSTKSDPGPAFPWPWVYAAATPAFDPATIGELAWDEVPGVYVAI